MGKKVGLVIAASMNRKYKGNSNSHSSMQAVSQEKRILLQQQICYNKNCFISMKILCFVSTLILFLILDVLSKHVLNFFYITETIFHDENIIVK